MNTYGTEPLRLLLDLETRIAAIDGRLAAELGHDPADLLHAPFSLIIEPADLQVVGEDLVALVTGAVRETTQRRLLRSAGGQPVPAILAATTRSANGGAVTGFTVAILLDGRHTAVVPTLPDHMRRLNVASALIDDGARIVDSNLSWGQLFASPAAVTPGAPLSGLVVEEDREALAERITDLTSGTLESVRLDIRAHAHDDVIWCRLGLVAIDNRNEYFSVTAEDVSAEITRRRVLEANEALFRSVSEHAPVGVARLAPDLTVVYANAAFSSVLGSTNVIGLPLSAFVHASERERITELVEERIAARDTSPMRVRTTADGGGPVDLRIAVVLDADLGVVGHVITVEEGPAVIPTPGGPSALVPGLLGTGTDLVGVADLRTGELLHLNDNAAQFFGLSGLSGLTEISVRSLYATSEHERYLDEVYPALRRGEVWTGELAMVDAQGETRVVLQSITPDLGPDGEPERASSVGTDVTGGRTDQDDLVYRATHDQLTGLPNRGLLRDHLDLALARSARDRHPIAVLFIDLDRFKSINDTYGHDVGDELLRVAAQRMADVLRPSDTVARIGGDEFIVLCEDIEGEVDALMIARRIRDALTSGDLVVRGVTIDVDTSIGVALSNGTSTGTADGDTLIRQADAAMYRAKQSGRARIELFDDVLRDRTQRRTEMTEQLHQAIQDQELEVHYQPMVDLTTGRVASVEAFARWLHPTRGLLRPADFLELAIDTGLDTDLDRLVIERACQDAARWYESLGDAAPRVHVNVTGRSTLSGTLPAALDHCLRVTQIPPEKLCLEMSESFLMEGGELAEGRIDQIRSLGVTLAIDDVGTAATSLQRLQRYQLDYFKIDSSLVAEMSATPEGDRLVGAAAAMGRALDLQVTVEGVEDAGTVARLRDLGAEIAQGLAFADAMPAARIEPLLTLRSTLARADHDRDESPPG